MHAPYSKLTAQLEPSLARTLRGVVADLRLLEADDLIGQISREKWANIAHLVSSSSELFLLPGTLRFSNSAEVVVSWNAPPAIFLDMELRTNEGVIRFRLMLGSDQAGVKIIDLSPSRFGDARADQLGYLASAIADTRLMPLANCLGS